MGQCDCKTHPALTIVLSGPGGSDDKESACNAGDLVSNPGLGRSPGEGNGYPLLCSDLENSRQRSMAGYNPWGCKESDTTEGLTHIYYQT